MATLNFVKLFTNPSPTLETQRDTYAEVQEIAQWFMSTPYAQGYFASSISDEELEAGAKVDTDAPAYKHTHTSKIDDRHQIEVWENAEGERYFLPLYSRTGRTWANYRIGGKMAAFPSYGKAKHHIDMSLK